MIEDIKGRQSEVKAYKSDKRLWSYGHLKFGIVSHQFWMYVDDFDNDNKRCRHLLVVMQMRTRKYFDITGGERKIAKRRGKIGT